MILTLLLLLIFLSIHFFFSPHFLLFLFFFSSFFLYFLLSFYSIFFFFPHFSLLFIFSHFIPLFSTLYFMGYPCIPIRESRSSYFSFSIQNRISDSYLLPISFSPSFFSPSSFPLLHLFFLLFLSLSLFRNEETKQKESRKKGEKTILTFPLLSLSLSRSHESEMCSIDDDTDFLPLLFPLSSLFLPSRSSILFLSFSFRILLFFHIFFSMQDPSKSGHRMKKDESMSGGIGGEKISSKRSENIYANVCFCLSFSSLILFFLFSTSFSFFFPFFLLLSFFGLKYLWITPKRNINNNVFSLFFSFLSPSLSISLSLSILFLFDSLRSFLCETKNNVAVGRGAE